MDEHFWSKVDRSAGEASCWPWTDAINRDGYGIFSVKPHTNGAHRVALKLDSGVTATSLLALHKCDNRACCNPARMYWGTPSENTADMMARNPPGTWNPSRKLSNQEAVEIFTSNKSLSALSREYGVCVKTVRQIRNGQKRKAATRGLPKPIRTSPVKRLAKATCAKCMKAFEALPSILRVRIRNSSTGDVYCSYQCAPRRGKRAQKNIS
jgi:hypothetical protein